MQGSKSAWKKRERHREIQQGRERHAETKGNREREDSWNNPVISALQQILNLHPMYRCQASGAKTTTTITTTTMVAQTLWLRLDKHQLIQPELKQTSTLAALRDFDSLYFIIEFHCIGSCSSVTDDNKTLTWTHDTMHYSVNLTDPPVDQSCCVKLYKTT